MCAVLALAACERAEKAETKAPSPAAEIREVAAADGYGEAGDAIRDVAFWSHPSVNFESLVIAATDDGLQAYNIETGDLVSSGGDPAKAVEIIYAAAEDGAAQGYAIAALSQSPSYQFLAVDNQSRALSPVIVESGAPASGNYCAGRRGDGAALYEIGQDGVAVRLIEIAAGKISLGDPQPFAATGGAACHFDDRTGDVVTVGADGAIRRLDADSGEDAGIAIPAGPVGASAIILKKGGGQIAVLDPASAVISLYGLTDGRALGSLRVKSTFDLDAVDSATAIAAGYGNYGAIYRDGALAVVTDEGAPIRLVPWNGVLDALGVPLGEGVDPRNPQPAAVDGSLIDIELKQP